MKYNEHLWETFFFFFLNSIYTKKKRKESWYQQNEKNKNYDFSFKSISMLLIKEVILLEIITFIYILFENF